MKKKSVKIKKNFFLNVVFFARENCRYSKELVKFLSKKTNLTTIYSKKKNEKNNFKNLLKKKIDYIFCFRSLFILKKDLLNHVRINSINFHPGTPNYRGIGCTNFAILNNSKTYGSTAHLIDTKIDNGKIIDVSQFKVKKKSNINYLISKTHLFMFYQARKIISKILKNKKNINILIRKNKKKKWTKKIYTQKDLEKLYQIDLSTSPSELEKILRATVTKKFKPYYLIEGIKYYVE